MADRMFTVDIVTPDRVVLSDRAAYLQAPGVCGSFGILSNHSPLLSELAIGELRYRKESGQEVRLALNGGFLQVFDNHVTVLADSAERAEEIDLERARLARERYRKELQDLAGAFSDPRHEAAQAGVDRAQNRLRVAGER